MTKIDAASYLKKKRWENIDGLANCLFEAEILETKAKDRVLIHKKNRILHELKHGFINNGIHQEVDVNFLPNANTQYQNVRFSPCTGPKYLTENHLQLSLVA